MSICLVSSPLKVILLNMSRVGHWTAHIWSVWVQWYMDFSINTFIYCKCIFSYYFLNDFFCILYSKYTLYNTYKVQNMWVITITIIIWLHLRHVKVPKPGTEPTPQQWPKPCSDTTRSLNCCAARELPQYVLTDCLCYQQDIWTAVDYELQNLGGVKS